MKDIYRSPYLRTIPAVALGLITLTACNTSEAPKTPRPASTVDVKQILGDILDKEAQRSNACITGDQAACEKPPFGVEEWSSKPE